MPPVGIMDIAPARVLQESVWVSRPNPDDPEGPELLVELGPFRGLKAQETVALLKRYPHMRKQWLASANAAKPVAGTQGGPVPDPGPITDAAFLETLDSLEGAAEVLPALIAAGAGAIGNAEVEARIAAKITEREQKQIAEVINRLTGGNVREDGEGEADPLQPGPAGEPEVAPAAA
jgi:hypothetical protein